MNWINKKIIFIANNRFLHNLISFIINLFPQIVYHNISKYISIKKIIYNIGLDQIPGDYCEFGCFTGATLNHALYSYQKYIPSKEMTFYGFDSFEGFPVEVHSAFKSENFKVDYNFVKKLEKKFNNCKIIKGYFKDSLKRDDIKKNINKISVAFIDCDIGFSAIDVFEFIKPRLSFGAFIMIDDYFNIDKTKNSILATMHKYFSLNKDIYLHSHFGNGGIIFRYLNNSKN